MKLLKVESIPQATASSQYVSVVGIIFVVRFTSDLGIRTKFNVLAQLSLAAPLNASAVPPNVFALDHMRVVLCKPPKASCAASDALELRFSRAESRLCSGIFRKDQGGDGAQIDPVRFLTGGTCTGGCGGVGVLVELLGLDGMEKKDEKDEKRGGCGRHD